MSKQAKKQNKKRVRKVYKTKLWKVTKKGQTFDSIFLKMETVRNRLLALKNIKVIVTSNQKRNYFPDNKNALASWSPSEFGELNTFLTESLKPNLTNHQSEKPQIKIEQSSLLELKLSEKNKLLG